MPFFSSPIADIAAKIRRNELKSADVVAQSLDAIKKRDAGIRAFISVQADAAMACAERIDALPPSEKAAMPLAGIPIGVKDNICTAGVPTTCGSRMLENFKPPYNAAVVEAIERAGAVIVGKTNLDEFAMGSSTESSFFGATKNPHDPDRIPGGSSGGSAAAVAAGLTPIALGSDTGGSIRQPAGHCGVIGLKPTYGRVSRYGLVAFASSLDQIGPFGTDIRDAGLLLSVISAPDSRDSTNGQRPFHDDLALYSGGPKGMTIGVPREYFGDGLSGEVRAAIDAAKAALAERGARCIDISLPNLRHAIASYYIICTAEASSNLARYDGVKYGYRAPGAASLLDMYETTRQQGFGAEVKRRIMLGTYVLSAGYYDAYYLKAARVRTLIARDFEQAFTQCDAVISPVSPTPAFRLGEKCDDPLQMYLGDIYTVSANLAGIPGISIPCGEHAGLPIGVQFMAPQWREDTLMRVGAAVQAWTHGA